MHELGVVLNMLDTLDAAAKRYGVSRIGNTRKVISSRLPIGVAHKYKVPVIIFSISSSDIYRESPVYIVPERNR